MQPLQQLVGVNVVEAGCLPPQQLRRSPSGTCDVLGEHGEFAKAAPARRDPGGRGSGPASCRPRRSRSLASLASKAVRPRLSSSRPTWASASGSGAPAALDPIDQGAVHQTQQQRPLAEARRQLSRKSRPRRRGRPALQQRHRLHPAHPVDRLLRGAARQRAAVARGEQAGAVRAAAQEGARCRRAFQVSSITTSMRRSASSLLEPDAGGLHVGEAGTVLPRRSRSGPRPGRAGRPGSRPASPTARRHGRRPGSPRRRRARGRAWSCRSRRHP